MNNSSRTKTILLAILIIVGLGILYFQVSGKMIFPKKENIQEEVAPQESKKAEEVSIEKIDEQGNIQKWKAFESKYLPISFTYKESWGEPKETYLDKDNCEPQKSEGCKEIKKTKVKKYNLVFPNTPNSPKVCAIRFDTNGFDNVLSWCYQGNIPEVGFFQRFNELAETITDMSSLTLSNHLASTFFYSTSAYETDIIEKKIFTRIDNSNFKAIDISLPYYSVSRKDVYQPKDLADLENKRIDAVKNIKNNTLNQEMKNLEKDFNFFIESIKINDK